MSFSLEDSISALYASADILEYPNKNYLDRVKELYSFIDSKFELFDLEYIEAEYIRVFNMDSSKLKMSLFASWWIDGKMGGRTLSEISDFYESCGYEIDAEVIRKPFGSHLCDD